MIFSRTQFLQCRTLARVFTICALLLLVLVGAPFAIGTQAKIAKDHIIDNHALNSNGELSPWASTSKMTTTRYFFASAATGSHVYVMGGASSEASDPSSYLNSVEYADVQSDGELGQWLPSTSLNSLRYIPAAASVNQWMYITGGKTLSETVNTVERAKIHEDGSLGTWLSTSSMLAPRSGHVLVTNGNVVYAIGGIDWEEDEFLASVEYSEILSDGSLGPWHNTSVMNSPHAFHGAAIIGNYLFVLAGQGGMDNITNVAMTVVERALINGDGSLGTWELLPELTTRRCNTAAVTVDHYIYVVGGATCNGTLHSSVERTLVMPDGTITGWEEATTMPEARSSHAVLGVRNTLYAIGGFDDQYIDTDRVIFSQVGLPKLTSFQPSAISSDVMTEVTVHGMNFVDTPVLSLEGTGALEVSVVSSSTLTVTVPAGLVPGWYDAFLMNGGATVQLTNALRVDGSGPTSVGQHGVSINDAALYTNQTAVTLTISSLAQTTDMQVSNDGGFAGVEWQVYRSHIPWQITEFGSYVIPRTVYVRYRSLSGEVSPTYSDDIVLDVTAPTGSIEINRSHLGRFVLGRFVLATSSVEANHVTLYLSASDDVSGVTEMQISNEGSFVGAIWEPYAMIKEWNTNQGDTQVYVQFRDGAGNESTTYSENLLRRQSTSYLPLLER